MADIRITAPRAALESGKLSVAIEGMEDAGVSVELKAREDLSPEEQNRKTIGVEREAAQALVLTIMNELTEIAPDLLVGITKEDEGFGIKVEFPSELSQEALSVIFAANEIHAPLRLERPRG